MTNYCFFFFFFLRWSLARESEDTIDEVEQLRQKVEAAGMPADVREKVESELQKLKMMSAMSAEATVVRSYVEWMLQVPWHKRTKVKKDIAKAEGEAKSLLTKAKAEAEANRIISNSLTPTLVEYEKIKQWNGILPQVQGSGASIVNLK